MRQRNAAPQRNVAAQSSTHMPLLTQRFLAFSPPEFLPPPSLPLDPLPDPVSRSLAHQQLYLDFPAPSRSREVGGHSWGQVREESEEQVVGREGGEVEGA